MNLIAVNIRVVVLKESNQKNNKLKKWKIFWVSRTKRIKKPSQVNSKESKILSRKGHIILKVYKLINIIIIGT